MRFAGQIARDDAICRCITSDRRSTQPRGRISRDDHGSQRPRCSSVLDVAQ
ncbi:hypothetical protein I553_9217 [Mycobacterium xenopi 4042]|uniref:Uncharacterized protein n=1 Tax=Mycobacterium xenopi 4042 TaxID=1299334 RepID=X8A9L5_MYCXE|nr:hypothetical protein I553_9217 [Mycobacterium xenopi 4042]